MSALAIRPRRRADAFAFVRAHHSHHRRKKAAADVFRLGAYVDGERPRPARRYRVMCSAGPIAVTAADEHRPPHQNPLRSRYVVK